MATPSPSKGEGLRRDQRLGRRADFLRCYRRGHKRHGELATLHFHPNRRATTRLGITASRKVGKAVVRHRVKRRIREIFRRYPHRWELPYVDLVLHLKPAASAAGFAALEAEVIRLLSTLIDPYPRRGKGTRRGPRQTSQGQPRKGRPPKEESGNGPRNAFPRAVRAAGQRHPRAGVEARG